jgi:hypothetical protein
MKTKGSRVGRYTKTGENRLAFAMKSPRALNRTRRIRKLGSIVGTAPSNNRGPLIQNSYDSNSESLDVIPPNNNRGILIHNSYLSNNDSVLGTAQYNNRGNLIHNSYSSNSESLVGIPSTNNRGIFARNSYNPNMGSTTGISNSGDTHTTLEGISSSGSNIHPYPYNDRLTKNEANVLMNLSTKYNSYNVMRNTLLEMNIPEKSKQKLARRVFHMFGNNL